MGQSSGTLSIFANIYAPLEYTILGTPDASHWISVVQASPLLVLGGGWVTRVANLFLISMAHNDTAESSAKKTKK